MSDHDLSQKSPSSSVSRDQRAHPPQELYPTTRSLTVASTPASSPGSTIPAEELPPARHWSDQWGHIMCGDRTVLQHIIAIACEARVFDKSLGTFTQGFNRALARVNQVLRSIRVSVNGRGGRPNRRGPSLACERPWKRRACHLAGADFAEGGGSPCLGRTGHKLRTIIENEMGRVQGLQGYPFHGQEQFPGVSSAELEHRRNVVRLIEMKSQTKQSHLRANSASSAAAAAAVSHGSPATHAADASPVLPLNARTLFENNSDLASLVQLQSQLAELISKKGKEDSDEGGATDPPARVEGVVALAASLSDVIASRVRADEEQARAVAKAIETKTELKKRRAEFEEDILRAKRVHMDELHRASMEREAIEIESLKKGAQAKDQTEEAKHTVWHNSGRLLGILGDIASRSLQRAASMGLI